jgi:hypothetical protein
MLTNLCFQNGNTFLKDKQNYFYKNTILIPYILLGLYKCVTEFKKEQLKNIV